MSFDGSIRVGVPPGADTVTVQARDRYAGRPYEVTHAGTVRVKAWPGATRVRLALSEGTPI
jgi:hypothetical protein